MSLCNQSSLTLLLDNMTKMLLQQIQSALQSILLLISSSTKSPQQSNSSQNHENPGNQKSFEVIPAAPICVIGAGISGLNTALLLQDRGYKVEVYEKEPIPGGKVFSYRVPGEIQVEMCHLTFSIGSDSLRRRITQFHLTPIPADFGDRTDFNPKIGIVYPPTVLNFSQNVQLRKVMNRYRDIRRSLEPHLAYGYLNTTSELFVPTSKWLKSKKLEDLIPAFTNVITIEGYGHLDDIPALYSVQVVDDAVIDGMILKQPGVAYTLREGLDVLMSRMASSAKVHLKEVINIDRSGQNQVLTLNTKEKKNCSRVVLAFPPLLSRIQNIIKDLSPNEKSVLEQVKVHKYISSASYIPPLNKTLYLERPPVEGTGEATSFIHQSSLRRQNIFSTFSWIRGDFSSAATREEVSDMTRQLSLTLRKMSPNPETFFILNADHFPHVTTESLRTGFYQAFDALQGRNGLYYATTLLRFESMEKSLEMTEAFVDRYF